MMEAKRTEYPAHASIIGTILRIECNIPGAALLVVVEKDNFCLAIANGPTPPFRRITTDSGHIESVLEMPIRAERHTRKYWVGIQENWAASRHKIRFIECLLRLYVSSGNEEPARFLRLEWVVPEVPSEKFPGKHAGHPHWHIDRSVLAVNRTLLESLEKIASGEGQPLEDFSALTPALAPTQGDLSIDCAWVQRIHLPAQAGWIKKWNGTEIPGPHQSEPSSLLELENWWSGALRYFVHELSGLRI